MLAAEHGAPRGECEPEKHRSGGRRARRRSGWDSLAAMAMKRLVSLALAAAVLCLVSTRAAAFCGFFVSGAGGPLVNDATQVALMRDGVRTVLTMRNSYKGPPEDFALVIPVPVVLQQSQVRTLPVEVFEHLDQLTAPRLVEYWEQDPCPEEDQYADQKEGGTGTRAKQEEGSAGGARPRVRVEAEFAVGEYDIVILSADDALALDAWLRSNHYAVPAGIEPYLRPYVQAGSKFFVAKVDVGRVKFTWGRAALSPLRFHYDTDVFSLPIRLGLANADGPQDLVVYVLASDQRYEVANYDNLFIPTNLEVRDDVRKVFPSFYATLFDRTVAARPRAVVTEYSWAASSCDPCPTPPLGAETLAQLGGDVVAGGSGLVVTRLHARYGRETLGEDFVFRTAPAVTGGREGQAAGGGADPGSPGAVPASSNAFQGRYVIRHPWEGPVTCEDPSFGEWGSPPGGARPPPSMGMTTRLRRDAPLAELILDGAPSAAHRDRGPAAVRPGPSLWNVVRVRADRVTRRAPWLPLVTWGIGLVAVLVAARRGRARPTPGALDPVTSGSPRLAAAGSAARSAPAGVLRHAAIYLVLGATPAALLLSRRLVEQVRDAPHGYGLIALFEVAAAVLVGLSALGQKRSRSPRHSWLWALAALAPLAAGVADHRSALLYTAASARSEADSPETYERILMLGESEALQSIVLGAAGSALLLAFAAIGLARLLPRGVAPRGLARNTAVVAVGWAGATFALMRPAVRVEVGWPRLAVLGVVLAAGGFALWLLRGWPPKDAPPSEAPVPPPPEDLRGLAGASASSSAPASEARVPRSADPPADTRDPHAATAVHGTWFLVLAMAAAVAASAARVKSEGIGSVAGASIDPFQAGVILSATLEELASFAWRTPLLLVAVLAPLAPLWLHVRRHLARPAHQATAASGRQEARLRPLLALTGVSVAALVGLGLLFRAAQGELRALHLPLPEPDRLDLVAALQAPDFASGYPLRRTSGRPFTGPALLVDRHGRLLGSLSTKRPPEPFDDALFRAMGEPSDDAGAPPEPLLVPDAQLTLGDLVAALAPVLSRRQTAFRWVVGHGLRAASGLGVYASMVDPNSNRGMVDVQILPRVQVRPAAPEAAPPSDAPPGPAAPVANAPPARGGPVPPPDPRLVLLVQVGEARRTLQLLSGASGRYQALLGKKPFVLGDGTERGRGSSLAAALAGVREVLLYAKPSLDVGALTTEILAILEHVQARPGTPAPTLVLTSDPSVALQ
jgi:hypothetical protein